MGSKEEQIIAEARAYINGGQTIADTAKSLGITKRTLQLHLGKLKSIDAELYTLVLERKTSNQNAGRRLGGMIGKRGVTYTEEEAQMIANSIASQHLTYQKAEEIFGIPSSTIYEMVHRDHVSQDTRDQLELIAMENHRNSSIEVIQKGSSKR